VPPTSIGLVYIYLLTFVFLYKSLYISMGMGQNGDGEYGAEPQRGSRGAKVYA